MSPSTLPRESSHPGGTPIAAISSVTFTGFLPAYSLQPWKYSPQEDIFYLTEKQPR